MTKKEIGSTLDLATAADCMAEEILHNMTMRMPDREIGGTLRDKAQYYFNMKMQSLTEEAYDGFAFFETVYDIAFEKFEERMVDKYNV